MRPDQRVYLVLPTSDIGGAEKRFGGLWLHLRTSGLADARLVAPHALLTRVRAIREFAAVEEHEQAMHGFDADGSLRPLAAKLRALHSSDPEAVFHFVMIPPVLAQAFLSRRTIFSVTTSSFASLSRLGIATIYAGALRASRTDFLEPRLHERFAKHLWFKRDAFSVTPGSFVDLEFYRPAAFAERRNLLAFCGLFSPEKQAARLVDAIPQLNAALRARGVADPEFVLMGRDIAQPGIVAACEGLPPGVNVRAYQEANPNEVLSRAKVFFSLQRATNYPSKSLLEAMACGAVPIVTDTGDSRRIAPEALAYYVPREFTADDLIPHCLAALALDQDQYDSRVTTTRAFLERNFSLNTMAAYFLSLYEAVAAL